MTVREFARWMEERIPSCLSESWDNDGVMVMPDENAGITGVLCALDATSVAIDEALRRGCNVIVTHHPLVFRPVDRVVSGDSVGKRIIACVRNGITVLSYHTRLDSMEGGVNDCLSDAVGLEDRVSFLPFARIGKVEAQPFESFVSSVSKALGTDRIRCVKAHPDVRTVALVSGSGKDEIRAAIDAGADTFLTGEVMHNHAVDCMEYGLNLICATHFATERIVVPFLGKLVREAGLCAEEYVFDEVREYGI